MPTIHYVERKVISQLGMGMLPTRPVLPLLRTNEQIHWNNVNCDDDNQVESIILGDQSTTNCRPSSSSQQCITSHRGILTTVETTTQGVSVGFTPF